MIWSPANGFRAVKGDRPTGDGTVSSATNGRSRRSDDGEIGNQNSVPVFGFPVFARMKNPKIGEGYFFFLSTMAGLQFHPGWKHILMTEYVTTTF